jgi:hypothetical protein
MDKTLKFLVGGAIIAAGLAAFCAISNGLTAAQHREKLASLESTVAALQAKCVAESEKNTKSGTGWRHDPLVCDPKELANISSNPGNGIRKEMAVKETALYNEQQYYPMQLPYLIALAIGLIAGLPWSWYFLLRRIRELSDAIRGK